MDSNMTISCARCYYARERYNRAGNIIGYDCACSNYRFIPADEAAQESCGMFAERD